MMREKRIENYVQIIFYKNFIAFPNQYTIGSLLNFQKNTTKGRVIRNFAANSLIKFKKKMYGNQKWKH